MPGDVLTAEARDDLVRRIAAANGRLFPADEKDALSGDAHHLAQDDFYLAIGAYFDGLPRVVMSACPFCGQALERAFDPWGLDGLWWGLDAICEWSEPSACEHFRVLLGALAVDESQIPPSMLMPSQPGPEVPFVVPRLLSLPNMVAVVGRLPMERGGPAHAIAYFSDIAVDPVRLHQEWRRNVHWLTRDGKAGWTYANDPLDFELETYLASGRLAWVLLDAGESPPRVRRAASGERCPFVGLPGARQLQSIGGGQRSFLPMPDGTPPNPFEQ